MREIRILTIAGITTLFIYRITSTGEFLEETFTNGGTF